MHDTTAPNAGAELPPLPAAALPERTRRFRGRAPVNDAPKMDRVTLDGREAVRVSLGGKRGEGRFVILDADVWDGLVVPMYGAGWGVNASGKGTPYVCRSVQCFADEARRGSKQRSHRAILRLHRVVAEPKPREVVLFRNGDTLDLRRANLECVTKAEAAKRRRLALPIGATAQHQQR